MTAAQVAYAVADLLVEHGLVTKAEETRAVEIISDHLNQVAMVEEEKPEQPQAYYAHVQKMDAEPFVRKCVNDASYDSRTLERVTPSEQVRKGIATAPVVCDDNPFVDVAGDFTRKKINMIKQLRDETGASLLEAKLSVEAANVEYESAKERYYQMYNPERLSADDIVRRRMARMATANNWRSGMSSDIAAKTMSVFEKMKKRYG